MKYSNKYQGYIFRKCTMRLRLTTRQNREYDSLEQEMHVRFKRLTTNKLNPTVKMII